MTSITSKVIRRTLVPYRYTVHGAVVSPTGRRLIASLFTDGKGEYLSLREERRRATVVLDLATLYCRGLRSMTRKAQ